MQPKTRTTLRRLDNQRCIRSNNGAMVAELGPTLWVLVFFLFFPLLNLATVGLRYTYILGTSRDAARTASVAKTFFTNLDYNNESAVNAASNRANYEAAQWRGVRLVTTQTNLLITNLATKAIQRRTTPLTAQADPTVNMYQVEVVLTADVYPLVTYRGPIFGNIPGLTGPARFSIATEQLAENTSGLHL